MPEIDGNFQYRMAFDCGNGMARTCEWRVLFEVIEVRVGGGVTEDAAHGDDLTFVMEGVGEHVMED